MTRAERAASVQLSVYPLRQQELAPAIDAAVAALRDAGLDPVVGPMSTTVTADPPLLFQALGRAFQAASAQGDIVMTLSVSNACKVPRG